MTRFLTNSSRRQLFWLIAFFALLALPRWAVANGADLPPQIDLKGFLKPEDGRLRLLVRVPLVLSSFSLPQRGPGYLDLANIDDALNKPAAATGHQIELFANSVALAPTASAPRISLPSDRSFSSYATALAHLQGAPLPIDTDLFWNQGFFDTQLDYPAQSLHPNLWIRVNVAPELGDGSNCGLSICLSTALPSSMNCRAAPVGSPQSELVRGGLALCKGWLL